MTPLLVAGLAVARPEPTVIAAGIASELVPALPMPKRIARDDADLVLWYGGEQEGELGPCGCSVDSMGGVARIAGWVASNRALPDPPASVLVNPGGWLTTTLSDDGVTFRADTPVKNAAMVEALAQWDALNVSFRDLPWLGTSGFPRNAVSANVLAGDGAGPAPWRIVERGGLRIAVTGVTGSGLDRLQPPGFSIADPVASLRAHVPQIDADLLVVLAYDTGTATDDLARIPGVDVVIETAEFAQFDPATREGEALWARAWRKSERLGELRLTLHHGTITGALDRSIPLDGRVRPDASLVGLERETAARVARIEEARR